MTTCGGSSSFEFEWGVRLRGSLSKQLKFKWGGRGEIMTGGHATWDFLTCRLASSSLASSLRLLAPG